MVLLYAVVTRKASHPTPYALLPQPLHGSLSKSYGLAGWRVGYVAYPASLHSVMLKAQDTFLTNCPIISQKVALAALRVGAPWVRKKVKPTDSWP